MESSISQINSVEILISRLDQIDRIAGLKGKVNELEQSDKNREK
jgi:hypothetical protein